MRIFVTGGTGFVGREVMRQLAAAGHEVVGLVRPGSEGKLVKDANIRIHPGDVTEPDSLPGGMAGCDAVMHLVGIIREFPERGVTYERLHVEATANVIAAAVSQGVGRYLHMSANGVRPDSAADYHRTKWRAEEEVRASDLHWTIFRPSLIFGPGSEFVAMLEGLVRSLPVVPVIGDGRYRLQPVAVGQVAETFLKALAMPETAGRVFHLGGAESYPFDEILDLVGRAIGMSRVLKFHQPAALVRPVVRLLERCRSFPVTLDQVTMMLEGNVCDQGLWAETFDIEPVAFAEGIAGCLDTVRTKT
jgi:uncharacterized protein YbjT (DUF2867 family)